MVFQNMQKWEKFMVHLVHILQFGQSKYIMIHTFIKASRQFFLQSKNKKLPPMKCWYNVGNKSNKT